MKGQFTDYSQYKLLHKTTNIAKEISRLNDDLSESSLYALGDKLKRSVDIAEKKISAGYEMKSSHAKAKYFVQAQVSIEDGLSVLNLARSLKYGDYTELIAELKEVRDLLNLDSIKLIKSPTSRN